MVVLDNKIKYLQDKLEEQIQAFQRRRQDNKTKAFRFRWAIVLCSFLTTILIGIHSSDR